MGSSLRIWILQTDHHGNFCIHASVFIAHDRRDEFPARDSAANGLVEHGVFARCLVYRDITFFIDSNSDSNGDRSPTNDIAHAYWNFRVHTSLQSNESQSRL